MKSHILDLDWELKMQKCFNMRRIIHVYIFLSVLSLLTFNNQSFATTLNKVEKCLKLSTESTSSCVNQNLTHKTLNQCYALVDTVRSTNAKEKLKNYCFYQISEFPTLKSCVQASIKFFEAENKDQALFECYRQFAATTNKSSCLQIAKSMTYSDKRTYLENHCSEL